MKFATVLPFVAAAHAFVVPDVQIFHDLEVNEDPHEETSWWGHLPSKKEVVSSIDSAVDTIASRIDSALNLVEAKFHDALEHVFEEESEEDVEALDSAHNRHGGHHEANLTIYELISKSNHTTKFAKLVDEHESIVKLLNSTKANYTLFVPIDAAFEHIPDDKKPSKEFIEDLLKYHIGLGLYPAGRILATHTLPTALDEKLLGDNPQRLRTSAGLSGVRVNFYSKVVAVNIGAKNGVIHAVNHILVPPTYAGRELSLFPSKFSTLLLAYEKTNFVDFIHGVTLTGSTIFAPSNAAFAKLGPRANAFLFNTEIGLKYLRAILKYHIVANSTLYSDELYRPDSSEYATSEHYHVDLPTLLDEKSVSVDVARWGGWITVKVNGFVRVVVQDVIAKNGVIQVIGNVLIPPHKHHKDGDEEYAGEIDVEDLKERLADFVDEDSKQDTWTDL